MDGRPPLVEDRSVPGASPARAHDLAAGHGLFALVGRELQAVEMQLRAINGAGGQLLGTVATYGLASGGKRIRPALVLLAAAACGRGGDARAVRLAAAAEMMHAATLIHDDIVDRAAMRRGLPSATARWGSQVSVLVGDFLYARAIQMVVDDSDVRIMRSFADATVAMTEAEVLQLQLLHDLALGDADYLRIVTGKTAALMSASCRVGGLVADASEAAVEALAAYGANLGIAFQLVDDALDYVAREERIGKPVGSDFREGKITYPIMHVMGAASPEDRRTLEGLTGRSDAGNGELAPLFELVERYEAVPATMALADVYLARARVQLERLPDSPARRVLHGLVEFVRTRDR
jgi:octaprenyl-diphosphate synthase